MRKLCKILDMAHNLAKDLHVVGAMDAMTMRMMDELCGKVSPAQRLCTGKDSRSLTFRDGPITPKIKL